MRITRSYTRNQAKLEQAKLEQAKLEQAMLEKSKSDQDKTVKSNFEDFGSVQSDSKVSRLGFTKPNHAADTTEDVYTFTDDEQYFNQTEEEAVENTLANVFADAEKRLKLAKLKNKLATIGEKRKSKKVVSKAKKILNYNAKCEDFNSLMTYGMGPFVRSKTFKSVYTDPGLFYEKVISVEFKLMKNTVMKDLMGEMLSCQHEATKMLNDQLKMDAKFALSNFLAFSMAQGLLEELEDDSFNFSSNFDEMLINHGFEDNANLLYEAVRIIEGKVYSFLRSVKRSFTTLYRVNKLRLIRMAYDQFNKCYDYPRVGNSVQFTQYYCDLRETFLTKTGEIHMLDSDWVNFKNLQSDFQWRYGECGRLKHHNLRELLVECLTTQLDMDEMVKNHVTKNKKNKWDAAKNAKLPLPKNKSSDLENEEIDNIIDANIDLASVAEPDFDVASINEHSFDLDANNEYGADDDGTVISFDDWDSEIHEIDATQDDLKEILKDPDYVDSGDDYEDSLDEYLSDSDFTYVDSISDYDSIYSISDTEV